MAITRTSYSTWTSRRVCVIGAGPSGMSTLYHFSQLPDCPEIVCVEKQDSWGGMWNYNWRTGVDEYGEPCHASMYRDLWSNGPKEAFEYSDYTFEEHFGRPLPSYLPRPAIRDYLEGRWTRKPTVNLKKFVRFTTAVRSVLFTDKASTFKVVTCNLKTGDITEDIFTHVIVATGIFSTPHLPSYPGFESFNGRISHSHDFRNAYETSGQAVLIIGGSLSAEDVALQAIKFGAKQVIISWRSKPLGHVWPDGIEERPLLERVDGNKVFFKDGTTADVDSIILCTGYRSSFPFLEDRLRIDSENAFYPKDLYKGSMFLPAGNSRLFYVGTLIQFYTLTMLESIVAWTCMYIMGHLPGEPKEMKEMEEDSESWLQKSLQIKDEHNIVDFQTSLIEALVAETGLSEGFCKGAPMLHRFLQIMKNDNFANYRSHSYTSIFTGTTAPKQVPFMEAMDDSLECLLKAYPLTSESTNEIK